MSKAADAAMPIPQTARPRQAGGRAAPNCTHPTPALQAPHPPTPHLTMSSLEDLRRWIVANKLKAVGTIWLSSIAEIGRAHV